MATRMTSFLESEWREREQRRYYEQNRLTHAKSVAALLITLATSALIAWMAGAYK